MAALRPSCLRTLGWEGVTEGFRRGRKRPVSCRARPMLSSFVLAPEQDDRRPVVSGTD